MTKVDNDRSVRETGLRRCNDANPTRVGLSRPGLAWQTSSLARARSARLHVCSSARARVCVSDHHTRGRACLCNRDSQTPKHRGAKKEVVSRGWTAYLLGTISLSGGNAHAYTYARDARENRRADTRSEHDLDLTFDPRDSHRSVATSRSPVCYFGRFNEARNDGKCENSLVIFNFE